MLRRRIGFIEICSSEWHTGVPSVVDLWLISRNDRTYTGRKMRTYAKDFVELFFSIPRYN